MINNEHDFIVMLQDVLYFVSVLSNIHNHKVKEMMCTQDFLTVCLNKTQRFYFRSNIHLLIGPTYLAAHEWSRIDEILYVIRASKIFNPPSF